MNKNYGLSIMYSHLILEALKYELALLILILSNSVLGLELIVLH